MPGWGFIGRGRYVTRTLRKIVAVETDVTRVVVFLIIMTLVAGLPTLHHPRVGRVARETARVYMVLNIDMESRDLTIVTVKAFHNRLDLLKVEMAFRTFEIAHANVLVVL